MCTSSSYSLCSIIYSYCLAFFIVLLSTKGTSFGLRECCLIWKASELGKKILTCVCTEQGKKKYFKQVLNVAYRSVLKLAILKYI